MKIYGIADHDTSTCGHGISMDGMVIAGLGAYGAGPFPPFFSIRENAEAWIRENENKYIGVRYKKVVELELLDVKEV